MMRKRNLIILFQIKTIINFNIRKNISTQQNNNHNNNSGNRIENMEGKPPTYSNQRQIPIKNMKINNINSEDNVSGDNNSSWLFNKSSGSNSADINPRMYVLKRNIDSVTLPNTDDFNIDATNFEWKYEINTVTLMDEEFRFTIYQQHQSDVIIHEFLEKNIVGKITYNSDQFLIRTSFGYASTQGVCSYGYQLNILGWNKLKIVEEDPYSEVFQTNNHQLMNLMYTVARVWLGSYIQFPRSY